jgi:hypothetical protein
MSILTAESTITPPLKQKSCCETHEAYPDDIQRTFEKHFDFDQPFGNPYSIEHYFIHSQTAYNLLMRAGDLGIQLDRGFQSRMTNDRRGYSNEFISSITESVSQLGSPLGSDRLIHHGIEIIDPTPRRIDHQPVDLWAAMVKMIAANPTNELKIIGRDRLPEKVKRKYRVSLACDSADPNFAMALISPRSNTRKIKHIGNYPFFQKLRPYAEKNRDYTMVNLTDIPMGRDHVLPAGCILQRPFGWRHPVVLRMSAFCFNELDALSIYGSRLNIDTRSNHRGGDLHRAFEAWGELKEEAASGRL